jgi:hypothetical protein
MKRYYTTLEAGKFLGVHQTTVLRKARRLGILQGIGIGHYQRIKRDDLLKMVEPIEVEINAGVISELGY